MNLDARLLKNVDWWLLLTLVVTIGFGFVVLQSATRAAFPLDWTRMLMTQGAAVVLGFVLAFLICLFDYREFGRLERILYVTNLVLCGLVLVAGRGAEEWGATSWLNIGGFSLQPSELSKPFLIICLAAYLSRQPSLTGWLDLFKAGLYFLPHFIVVLLQPDIGTGLVLVVIFFAMLFMAGASVWKLGLVGVGGLGGVIGAVYLQAFRGVRLGLPEHAINRLLVFIDPSFDPYNAGYQLSQSKIAVGSGGLFGQGLHKGLQNTLNFLPEQHSDFIFAVAAEELGFLGAGTLILLFTFLLVRIVLNAAQAKDQFGALLCTGVAAMLGFHVLENIGMTMGIMPITGIPLPFVSHGGTSMMAYVAAMGFVFNVGMRRHDIMF